MNDTTASTLSIVSKLTDIVVKTISTALPSTTKTVLVYKAGSTLTPTNLGTISN